MPSRPVVLNHPIVLLGELDKLDQQIQKEISNVGAPIVELSENYDQSSKHEESRKLLRQLKKRSKDSGLKPVAILGKLISLGIRRFQIAQFRRRLTSWYPSE
ncbi:MAG: hypothetical protein RR853_06580 [Aurantimicrobium sp.]